MASSMRTIGARAIGAAAVLGLGLLGAPSNAWADYSYTFTLTPLNANGANASGTFTLNSTPSATPGGFALFTSINANLYSSGNSYSIDQVQGGSVLRNNGAGNIVGAIFYGSGYDLGLTGSVNINNDQITGAVGTTSISANGSSFGSSFFDAAPSAGGDSGGVPTPEVNAALGLMLAGATVAFLRRKRGDQFGPASN